MRKISLYIFLVVSCLLFLVTVILAMHERSGESRDASRLLVLSLLIPVPAGVYSKRNATVGEHFGTFIIFAISILCIVREGFLCATASNIVKVSFSM